MVKIHMTISRDNDTLVVNTEPQGISPYDSIVHGSFCLAGQALLELMGVDSDIDTDEIWEAHAPSNEDIQIIVTIKGIGPSLENN